MVNKQTNVVQRMPQAYNTNYPSQRDREATRSSSRTSKRTSSTVTTLNDPDPDVAVAVMGATGSGKTTFINMASGSNLRIGRGLQSCTNIVQVAQPFRLDGRLVSLIDTPGFDDTTRSDTDILRMIAAYLQTAYEHGKKLAGVIYIHRISDFRMGGISRRNFKMFRELCGDSTLQNVVIVTNMWGEVNKEIGEAREAELMKEDLFFKPVLEKGALMSRHDNSRDSALDILRQIIDNHPLALQIQRELVEQKKEISQTAAGAELNRELMAQIEKHKKEMRMLQQEMQDAIRLKDEETRRELEAESRKLQGEMNRIQEDAQKLVSEYSEEKKRMETRMKELVEASREEGEKNKAEYNRQMSILQRRLEQTAADSARERADLHRQIQELQGRSGGSGGFFGMIGRALDSVFGW